MRRLIVLSAAVLAYPLLLAGCSEQPPSDPRIDAPLVRVVEVQGANSVSRSFSGVMAARVQSDLGFRVSGKVLERLVDTGQSVKKGQPLLRLDPVDLKLAAAAQQEAVTAAKALAKQAVEDEVRYRRLRGTGAISVSAYDQAKAAADTANANLSAAIAHAKVSLNATQYAELIADADGLVMETLVEAGQVVAAGQVVVRLAHAGPREAIVQLPETLRPAIGSAGQATLFGQENIAIPAKLRQLSDTSDRVTRTFEARYVLEGDMAHVPLGTTVTINIANEQLAASNSAQVPIGALYDAGKGPGVWIIRENKVSWRPVAIQHLNDENAVISSDLQPHDQIVALGAHLLHEGMQVRVADSVAHATEGAAL
ncbi:MAG: efflux RND transporter periplasmic adaptor subunit [Cellvibrio sp.]|uniref:efflux RND transporter periplasmic adaptor subunit n=1 Tax=Cellvibrio sp. TaxID=1965322 RepID=UPI002723B0F6|nr:efflux RND transporter periplasmic adaptor subunit [Cellvibrio sp.]